jgi:hypothetical protein
MKIRLSLSSAIIAFGVVLAIGFTAVVSTSLYALKELKVGMRIKFRPRVEGHTTIACDLSLATGA